MRKRYHNARKVTGNNTGWKESYRKFILLKLATWSSQGPITDGIGRVRTVMEWSYCRGTDTKEVVGLIPCFLQITSIFHRFSRTPGCFFPVMCILDLRTCPSCNPSLMFFPKTFILGIGAVKYSFHSFALYPT